MGSEIIEIGKGIQVIDLALYLAEDKTLIIADLHIGIEDSLVKQGMLVPKFHFRDLVDRVERIFKSLAAQKKEVKVVVINGDLKHEFGRISDEEWRNTLKMLDWLARKCERIVLVRGNHDTILGPIAEKRKVTFADELLIGDKLICHGDRIPDMLSCSSATQGSVKRAAPRQASLNRQWRAKLGARNSRRKGCPPAGAAQTPFGPFGTSLAPLGGNPQQRPSIIHRKASQIRGATASVANGSSAAYDIRGAAAAIKTIIIGHEHPAVSIYEDLRKETYKAFIAGKWNRKNLIVQPSLNPLMEGTDVNSGKLLSPFLQKELGNFDAYIVADKVYAFGKLKKLYKP